MTRAIKILTFGIGMDVPGNYKIIYGGKPGMKE